MTIDEHFTYDSKSCTYFCQGHWTISHVNSVLDAFQAMPKPSAEEVTFQASQLEQFDSAGALALIQCINQLKTTGHQITLKDFTDYQRDLLKLIDGKSDVLHYVPPVSKKRQLLY